MDNLTVAQLNAQLQTLIASISDLDEESIGQIQKRLDSLTKPQGSLGQLEYLAKQLGGIQRTSNPKILKKAVLLMAGDHGVVEEGVSAFPQEVTPQMVYNIIGGGAAINVLARHANAEVFCTDVGVAFPLGEGTGAALTFHLVEAALHILEEMSTFADAGVSEQSI